MSREKFKVGQLVRFPANRWKFLAKDNKRNYDKIESLIGLVVRLRKPDNAPVVFWNNERTYQADPYAIEVISDVP